jgi:hypothetical protein
VFGRVRQREEAEVHGGLCRRGLDFVAAGRQEDDLARVAELERPRAGGDDAFVAPLRQAKADGVFFGFVP